MRFVQFLRVQAWVCQSNNSARGVCILFTWLSISRALSGRCWNLENQVCERLHGHTSSDDILHPCNLPSPGFSSCSYEYQACIRLGLASTKAHARAQAYGKLGAATSTSIGSGCAKAMPLGWCTVVMKM